MDVEGTIQSPTTRLDARSKKFGLDLMITDSVAL